MTAFARKVATLTGVGEDRIERLAGGDLSEVLLLRRPDGRRTVAKGGPATGTEAAMLRFLAGAGVTVPMVEGEHDGVLLLEYVEADGVFSPLAWADIGAAVRRLHDHVEADYGWPVDYRLGTVTLDNRQTRDWPAFWGQQRLAATAHILDRPTRERVERLAGALVRPSARRSPRVAAAWRPVERQYPGRGRSADGAGRSRLLLRPCEVDLAMLTLFGTPPPEFWDAYGKLAPDWKVRRIVYQLFPALVHLRLFGASYAGMVDRLLDALGA